MITNTMSWHSVNEVRHNAVRCCVANYYFSKNSPEDTEYFHVSSFRGRPEEPVADFVLHADANLRMGIRKMFKLGIIENPHEIGTVANENCPLRPRIEQHGMLYASGRGR